MWGKLTERNDRTRTKIISDPQELYRFLSTHGIQVANLMFASDDVVCSSWRYIAEENVPNLRHTNEVIGAYVTAGARIHLYGYLYKLQQRALYFDTDSITYIQPNVDLPLVETGDCLGAMTSELKPGFHIEEFVSGRPKCYVYRIVDAVTGNRETMCKVRGITLNYSASQTVNFDVMKSMILRGDDTETVTVYIERTIKRKRAGGRINIDTEPVNKICRVSFLKRRRLGDNTSVPFEYV